MDENRENIREKNLIPFKEGKSGNPKGKPLGQRNYATIYREALMKLAESKDKTPEELENEILGIGITRATKDYRFYKDLLDRLHGQATVKQETTHEFVDDLSSEEKIERAKAFNEWYKQQNKK